jgi:hypothetical protein
MDMIIREPDGSEVVYRDHSRVILDRLKPHISHIVAITSNSKYDYEKDRAMMHRCLRCYTCKLDVLEFIS